MSKVIVKYNNNEISPTPTVSRSIQFIDYSRRWGQVEQIDLACTVTGFENYNQFIGYITNIFSGQFKTLDVYDDATRVHTWPNVIVRDIVFPQNQFAPYSMVPYNVKLSSYQVPSGVTEPVNEYSFTQNQDGVVNVAHKIAAKGIRTNYSPIDNAINFVKQFVNLNPFTGCTPHFIQNGSGILFSSSETINRAEGYYAVNENYKFVTGSTLPYIETTSLSINDSNSEDYTTIDLNIKWQGSPINNNLSDLQNAVSSFNFYNTIANYGFATGNIYQNTHTVSQDSGQSIVEFKIGLISGVTNEFSGYFDYSIELDEDIVTNSATWRIEGEYVCKGPLSFKRDRVAAFKSLNGSDSFVPYLRTLINSSALFSYADYALNPIPSQLSINENTGFGTLKLAATFNDGDTYNNLLRPKYSVEIEPSKWLYELMPAANIEGHYTLQDLQSRSQAKIKIAMSSPTSGNNTQSMSNITAVMATLSGIYVSSGFNTANRYSSGISDVSMEWEFLGTDKIGTGITNAKIHGSVNNGYVRPKGFKFGY